MARVLTLLEDGYVDYEFSGPARALKAAGHEIIVASSQKGVDLVSKQGSKVTADLSYDEANTEDYDALFIPGGKSPEKVRQNPKAIEIVKNMAQSQKLIAAICHGPQVLVTADILKGKTATCWSSVVDELTSAGAKYLNQEVVIDENLITSRNPSDVPAFSKALLAQLE